MSHTFTECWMIFYKSYLYLECRFIVCNSEKDFNEHLEDLKKKGAHDICCLIPNKFFVPRRLETL